MSGSETEPDLRRQSCLQRKNDRYSLDEACDARLNIAKTHGAGLEKMQGQVAEPVLRRQACLLRKNDRYALDEAYDDGIRGIAYS